MWIEHEALRTVSPDLPSHWGVWILIHNRIPPSGLLPQAVLRNFGPSMMRSCQEQAWMKEEKNGVGGGLDCSFLQHLLCSSFGPCQMLGTRDLPVLPSHRPSCPSLSGPSKHFHSSSLCMCYSFCLDHLSPPLGPSTTFHGRISAQRASLWEALLASWLLSMLRSQEGHPLSLCSLPWVQLSCVGCSSRLWALSLGQHPAFATCSNAPFMCKGARWALRTQG